MSSQDLDVREPLALGSLFAGGEVLLIVGFPTWLLAFSVVHTVAVQAVLRETGLDGAGNELALWTVILQTNLVLLSIGISLAVAVGFVLVTGLGVVIWRLAALGISWLQTRRARRYYDGLAGGDEVAADAWSRNLPEREEASAEGEG